MIAAIFDGNTTGGITGTGINKNIKPPIISAFLKKDTDLSRIIYGIALSLFPIILKSKNRIF
jgi:hypothetical protein